MILLQQVLLVLEFENMNLVVLQKCPAEQFLCFGMSAGKDLDLALVLVLPWVC